MDFSRDTNEVGARFGKLIATPAGLAGSQPSECMAGKFGASEARRRADESYPLAEDGAVELAAAKLASLPGTRREIISFDHDYLPEAKDRTKAVVKSLDQQDVTFNLIKDPAWLLALAQATLSAQSLLKNDQQAVFNFYAGQTGGAAISPSSKDYVGALESLLLDLRSSYSLAWRAPEADGSIHKLRVEVRGRKDVVVQARKEYFAPTVQKTEK